MSQAIGLFFLMSAFAQGCTALTGTEAISNGVPAFKPPEWKNARDDAGADGAAARLDVPGAVLPGDADRRAAGRPTRRCCRSSAGASSARAALGAAAGSTALILMLAANTSFADFPRLASILARDRFLPRGFQFRGDRLAFTTGIVVLAVLAVALLVAFEGSLDLLIPLYAVGVFTSFTLSQAGMVVHWRRLRGPGWRRRRSSTASARWRPASSRW